MSTEHDDEPCQTTATAGLLCRNCVTDIDEAMRPKPVLLRSRASHCGVRNAPTAAMPTPGSMRCDEVPKHALYDAVVDRENRRMTTPQRSRDERLNELVSIVEQVGWVTLTRGTCNDVYVLVVPRLETA